MKTQKIYSKKEALLIIMDAAKIYHNNLENKDLLIVYKNDKNMETYEVGFLNSNFQHFTGTDTNMSATKFYSAALNNRLKISDFEFKNNELTSQKIDILKNAVAFPETAKMIGIYNGPKVQLEADIGAGNVQCVMTFRHDDKKGDNWLYPVGVQKEDVRDVTTKSPIIAILRKDSNDSIYNELTYKSKSINIDKLHIPKELKAIIATEILQQLNSSAKIEEIQKVTKNIVDNISDTKKVRISMKEKLPEMKEKSDKLFGQGQLKQQDLQYKSEISKKTSVKEKNHEMNM